MGAYEVSRKCGKLVTAIMMKVRSSHKITTTVTFSWSGGWTRTILGRYSYFGRLYACSQFVDIGKRWLELTKRGSMAGIQARAFCAMRKVTAPSSSRLHRSCGQPLSRIPCIVRLWNTKLTLRVLACTFMPMFGVSSLLWRSSTLA